MKYNPSLDGLRTLSVVPVVMFHTLYGRPAGGTIGVDVFFALSGYLITTILVRENASSGHIDIPAFYLRRVRRLAPALVGFLLLGGIAWRFTPEWIASLQDGPLLASVRYLRGIVPAVFYFTNWMPVFDGWTPVTILVVWSLSVEEQFYLVWPLTLRGILGRSQRLGRAIIIVLAAIAVLVLARAVGRWNEWRLEHYCSTFSRADELFAGAAIALIQEKHGRRLAFFASRAGTALAWCAGAVLLYFTLVIYSDDSKLFYGGFTIAAWCAAIVIVHVENARDGFIARNLARRSLVEIGKRSYGIYLYHWPVFTGTELLRRPHDAANFVMVTLLRFVATVAIAWLSYRYVESPFLKKRDASRGEALAARA